MKTPIDKIDRENRIFGYWFPPYKKYIPHRIKVLKLALKDLERINEEYGEVKRWWLRNLQQYYVFFYEKKGGKVRGVLGKDRTKDLIRAIL